MQTEEEVPMRMEEDSTAERAEESTKPNQGEDEEMESTEEVKLELETRIQQDTDPEPKMSTIQAKRRFMITDILNSAVESARDQQGPGPRSRD